MSKTVVIMDTEFTTWEGAMANNWGEDWQHRELVQIGALKVDAATLEPIEPFNILIRPVINPVLSDFFTELTGISNDDIKQNGVLFDDAYTAFSEFADGDTVWCYGWDGDVVHENCELYNRPYLIDQIQFETLHLYFEDQGVDTSQINSGKLAEFYGVDIEIHEHNAMDDVRSIHAALQHLRSKGKNMPFDAEE